MTVKTREQPAGSRPRSGRGARRTERTAAADVDAAADEAAPHARERLSGGPEDRARYHCHCGFVFEDEVTTSVDCPHCGSAQAW